jgi:hypothetical protein
MLEKYAEDAESSLLDVIFDYETRSFKMQVKL